MAETLVPTSYTRIKNRDSKQRLCRRMKNDEILGFVEKELGEVVGSQMAEQVLREGVLQLAVSPPILTSPSKHMGISAAGLKLLARGLYLHCK